MTGKSFRLTVAAIVLCVLAPGLFAAAPSNDDVGEQVDRITEPPPYDWLRRKQGPGAGGGADPGKGPARKVERTRPRGEADRSNDCDYEPPEQEPRGPGEDVEMPRGSGGCDGGGAPGSQEVAPPAPAEQGEGCSAPPRLDCGFDPGDCGCGQTAGEGGCGCVGPAGMAGPFGVIMGAIALGLVVFLLVRAFLGRRKDEDISAEVEELDAPEDVRMSQVAAIPVRTMMDRAREAAAGGDYKTAVGWAYLAGISDLGRLGFVELDRSTTNWTIVESTRRNMGPHEEAARLVRIFEDAFFGDRPPDEAKWRECEKIVEVDFGETASDQG